MYIKQHLHDQLIAENGWRNMIYDKDELDLN